MSRNLIQQQQQQQIQQQQEQQFSFPSIVNESYCEKQFLMLDNTQQLQGVITDIIKTMSFDVRKKSSHSEFWGSLRKNTCNQEQAKQKIKKFSIEEKIFEKGNQQQQKDIELKPRKLTILKNKIAKQQQQQQNNLSEQLISQQPQQQYVEIQYENIKNNKKSFVKARKRQSCLSEEELYSNLSDENDIKNSQRTTIDTVTSEKQEKQVRFVEQNLKDYNNTQKEENNAKQQQQQQQKKTQKKFLGFQNGINLSFASRTQQNIQKSKPNQDSIVSTTNLQNIPSQNMFTVLDGHGENGHQVSQYISKIMPEICENSDDLQEDPEEGLLNIFEELHEKLDEESMIDTTTSGTTAVTVLLQNNKVYCANLGDSRAILGQRKSSKMFASQSLSCDHKPTNFEEEERIEQYGGVVRQKHEDGPHRVWVYNPGTQQTNGLAMSRSFGDALAEEVGVIHEPEVDSFDLGEDDSFIILGTDGLYEFLENDQICQILAPYYLNKRDIEGACDALMDAAVKSWQERSNTSDDISFTILFLDALLTN